jgi:hypothetical protein
MQQLQNYHYSECNFKLYNFESGEQFSAFLIQCMEIYFSQIKKDLNPQNLVVFEITVQNIPTTTVVITYPFREYSHLNNIYSFYKDLKFEIIAIIIKVYN